jgi:hypothetical protein
MSLIGSTNGNTAKFSPLHRTEFIGSLSGVLLRFTSLSVGRSGGRVLALVQLLEFAALSGLVVQGDMRCFL